jgi:hypothetical protein
MNDIDDRALSTWSTPPHRPHSLARAPHACRTAADQWETREPNRFSRPAPHHRSDATRRPTSTTLTDDSGSASRPTTPSPREPIMATRALPFAHVPPCLPASCRFTASHPWLCKHPTGGTETGGRHLLLATCISIS